MHPMSSFTTRPSRRSLQLGGALLCALLSSACGAASTVQAPEQHRAGPAGRGYYSTFTPRDLVYEGRQGTYLAHTRQRPDIDAYLKPSALAEHRAATRRAKPRLERPAVVPRPEAASARPAPQLLATSVTPTANLSQPAPNDLERYAARERTNSKQMQYRGGDVVVISVSTLLVILLIVLLVLLLT
jgi:hypothetical protein